MKFPSCYFAADSGSFVRIPSFSLSAFHRTHSIESFHYPADPTAQTVLENPSRGFHCTDFIVRIPSCDIHRASSIVRIPSCGIHCASSILRIPLCGLHRADSHRLDSIVRIPSCGFNYADSIVRIPSYGFHYRVHSMIAFHHVLWSLELASKVFHDFFSSYDHGGEDAHSARRNSRKSAVAIGKEFGIAEE